MKEYGTAVLCKRSTTCDGFERASQRYCQSDCWEPFKRLGQQQCGQHVRRPALGEKTCVPFSRHRKVTSRLRPRVRLTSVFRSLPLLSHFDGHLHNYPKDPIDFPRKCSLRSPQSHICSISKRVSHGPHRTHRIDRWCVLYGEQIDLTILNDLYGTQLALADVVSSRYSHPDIQVFLQPQSGFE